MDNVGKSLFDRVIFLASVIIYLSFWINLNVYILSYGFIQHFFHTVTSLFKGWVSYRHSIVYLRSVKCYHFAGVKKDKLKWAGTVKVSAVACHYVNKSLHKVGFAGYTLLFLIFAQNIACGSLVEPPH